MLDLPLSTAQGDKFSNPLLQWSHSFSSAISIIGFFSVNSDEIRRSLSLTSDLMYRVMRLERTLQAIDDSNHLNQCLNLVILDLSNR